jgi:flavin reductase (DIM6/NTAB) family NADH-FMN oxidoreductase RutF
LPFIRASGNFAVNILTSEQEYISRCFATTSSERYEHFCYASFHVASTGSPILDEALAFIDSRIVAEYPGGDHVIFVGLVQAMGMNGHAAYADEEHQGQSEFLGLKMQEVSLSNNLNHNEQKAPLVYYRGKYRHLAQDYQRPSLAASYAEDVK